MHTKYRTIQLIPNPITDDRLTIGIIAHDTASNKIKITSNTTRIADIFHPDLIDWIRDFETEWKHLTQPQFIEKFNNPNTPSIFHYSTIKTSLQPLNQTFPTLIATFLQYENNK